MIDYAGFATALEGEIKRLVALRDQVLAAYALPTGSINGRTTVVTVTAAKPTAKSVPARKPGGKPSKITEAQREKLKAGWQRGDSPKALVDGLGVGPTWLNHAAKAGGWGPRGGGGKATTSPARSVKGTTMRRCPECREQTPANVATCKACGEITG